MSSDAVQVVVRSFIDDAKCVGHADFCVERSKRTALLENGLKLGSFQVDEFALNAFLQLVFKA